MKHLILVILLLFNSCVVNATGAASTPVANTMAERVKACTICHSDEGRVGRDAYYPRIAGKPRGYLFNQLRNFRDGRRHYQPMAILLENMSDAYMLEIADYFASLHSPYPAPEQIKMQAADVKLAKSLVNKGDPERDLPPCSACHGNKLMGIEPYIPGLLGLSRAYIAAQFGGWRNGGLMRGQMLDCMSEIAKKLTDDETNALAKWLASQPASGKPSPSSALLPELAQRCSSIAPSGRGTK